MKKLLFAFSWLLLGSLSLNAQTPTMETGLKHLENENYAMAKETFLTIAKNDPKNASVYYYIGEVSYRLEEYAAAEKAYKQGLDISSSCAECKIGLGKLALDQGKTAEAQELFESAARLGKKDANVFYLIGLAYLNSKKPNPAKAVEYLEEAFNMEPKNARYLATKGDAYKALNKMGEAMTAYELAVERDPTNTQAYISMARIWTGARKYEDAEMHLLKAKELSPNDALIYKELIEIYVRTGKYEKVTPLLEKYVSLTGSDVDAKVRLVKFLTFQAQDYQRAIEIGEEVLKTNPEQYTLHRWLAWAYFEIGKPQESYRHSKMLFDKIGKDDTRKSFPSDYDYWAKAAFEMDSLNDAAHIYRKYIELDSTPAYDIYGKLAKGYYDARDFEQAIKYYMKRATVKPLTVADEYYLGIALFYKQQYQKADSAFARVVEVAPDYVAGWLMRARCNINLDTAEVQEFLAKPHYEKYIEYASADPDKNKKGLIDAHKYLGVYYVQIEENSELALAEFEKALAYGPESEAEIEEIEGFIKLLKETLKGQR